GELETPSGLAIDRGRSLLYVADAKKHQVLCYAAGDGALVRAIGKRGIDAGEFNFPTNLSVDSNGRLYVTDTLNFRVQVFDGSGSFVSSIGTRATAPGTSIARRASAWTAKATSTSRTRRSTTFRSSTRTAAS